MEEELKKRMIAVIGSCAIHTTEWIAEKCAQVAIDYYKERDQALIMSGVVVRTEQLVCYKKCGKTEPYNDICLNCGSSINYDAN